MKRVLSIMLTLMLAFTMISGITVNAAVYEVVTQLTSGDYSTSLTPATTTAAAPTSPSKMIFYLSSGYASGKVTLKENLDSNIADGLTSAGAFELVTSGTGNNLRFYGHPDVKVGEKYQIKMRVYLAGSSDASVNTFTAWFGTNRKGSRSSAAGGTPTFHNIPINQWTEVTVITSPTKSGGVERIANGFAVTFNNGTAGTNGGTDASAYPTKIYVDGNISCSIVQEKAVEPSAVLAPVFKNNMIIQRNQPIDVWGTSTEAGKTVTVTLGGNSASTTTDATGKWKVTLPAMSAQTGLTLNMTCDDEALTNVNVNGIAIGEIILAAGQSNMAFDIDDILGIEDILADTITWNNVKIYRSTSPVGSFNEEIINNYAWANFGSNSFNSGSGIGLLVAYNLAKDYNIPVGVIEAASGGILIESLMSMETLHSRDVYADYITAYNTAKAGTPPTDVKGWKQIPTGNYNAWINPIKGLKVGSAIWYQGENNADLTVDKETDIYYYKQLDLFNQFRRDFGNANMPIAVIQLAPYSSSDFVKIRQSQLDIANDMNNVYLVTTADVGPTESDISSNQAIHPSNKKPVADRCTAVLKYALFGENVEHSSPLYNRMTVSGNEATLTFNNAYDFETVASFTNMVSSKKVSGSGNTWRFGLGSSASRMEFRDDNNTGNFTSLTKDSVANLSVTYPDIASCSTGTYLAKMTRTGNVGYVRFAELSTPDVFKEGDIVRVTVRAYPTEMVGNADTITWNIKGLRNTKSDGSDTGVSGQDGEKLIYIKPNQWNTIVYEGVCHYDMVSGVQIQFNPEGETSYPATIFFDDYMVVERVAATDIISKALKTSDGEAVTGFEIAGSDGVFYSATATINGNQINVSSENVANPVEVRYCYVPWAEDDHSTLGGNVVNAAGIPMGPFKAQVPNVAITNVTGSGYTYTVNLSNDVYNSAPGYVVAALYDGDVLVQVKKVSFNIKERKSDTQTVTFDPENALSDKKVKIMAWKSMETLVPYCAAVER